MGKVKNNCIATGAGSELKNGWPRKNEVTSPTHYGPGYPARLGSTPIESLEATAGSFVANSKRESIGLASWLKANEDVAPKPNFLSTSRKKLIGDVAESIEHNASSYIPGVSQWASAGNSQASMGPRLLAENVTIMRQEVISSTISSSGTSAFRSLFSKHFSPLTSSLYIGPRVLSKTALTFFMIAYSHEGTQYAIRDPDLDTCYLRELFGRLPGVRFGSLSRSNATLFRIKEKLRQLWDKTPAGTHLVLLLTGHGADNAMVLYGDESIDESELVRIIKHFRPNNFMSQSSSIYAEKIPGQRAWAAEFEEMTIPSSFLLIGFFMASSDASRYPGQTFEECLRLRIAQLSRFNGHLQHRRGCDGCRIRRECPDAFKTSNDYEQDVDLTQAQDALTHLHVLLARWPEFTKRCENVRVYMMGNKPFCKSNGLPVPLSRLRGVNTPVVEAAALDDVDRNGRYLIRSFPL
ncbi:hypothetical protein RhiLY_03279 [Ceratobasidium sp. AG-Ba]|nr:hypothetical protein RhiLY_03279 [Ceratobasidium sp. AG-Ba]